MQTTNFPKMIIFAVGRVENIAGKKVKNCFQVFFLFVAFVENNAAMGSIWYFENHVTYFVQNRRKLSY